MKAIAAAMVLSVILVFVSACGSVATPTAAPPSPPQPALATRAEDIVGTWKGMGSEGYYLRFHPDGTLDVAIGLENLSTAPDALLTFRFEGTHFIFTELETPGLDPCPAAFKTATYEIQLLENGHIRLVAVQDLCTQRRRTLALEHKPVLPAP